MRAARLLSPLELVRHAMRVPQRHRTCAVHGSSIYRDKHRLSVELQTLTKAARTISAGFPTTRGLFEGRSPRQAMQQRSNAGYAPRRRRQEIVDAKHPARQRRAQMATKEWAGE